PGDLERAGIIYVHMPGLGGLRQPRPDSVNTSWRNSGFRGYADYMQTPEFQTNLDALLRQARGGPTAISSASRNPNGVGARGSWATSAGLEIQARIILRLVCTYEGHIDMEIAVRCPRGQRGQ
ncbi:MAG: hypothetical protein DMD91_29405, partial [Candidatus Rokuibacteriota bacterium]